MSCKIDEALIIVDKAIKATGSKDKKEALTSIRARMVAMKTATAAAIQPEMSTHKGYTRSMEQLRALTGSSSEARNTIWNASSSTQKKQMLQDYTNYEVPDGRFAPDEMSFFAAVNTWNGVPFAKSPNANKTIKKPPVLDFKAYFNRLEEVMDSKLAAGQLKSSSLHTDNMVESLLGLDTDMKSFGMFDPKTKEVYYPDLAKFMETAGGIKRLSTSLYTKFATQIESEDYRAHLIEELGFTVEEAEEGTNKELFDEFVESTVRELVGTMFEQSIRVHEKIHGVVYDYVNENPTSVEVRHIDKLYKATLNLAKKKPELFTNVEEMADGTMYWQTNIQEFITEATTNPELVKVLASVDMEGNKVSTAESLLDKLVKLMRKIVGLDNSIHTELLSNVLAIAEKQTAMRAALNPNSNSLLVPARSSSTLGVDKLMSGFDIKDEFHITVLGFAQGRELSSIFEQDAEDRDVVKKLIDEANFGYTPTGEIYRIERDIEQYIDWANKDLGTKTVHEEAIIELVEAPGIEAFIHKVNKTLGTNFPVPFPHISLAVKGTKFGIGIANKEAFDKLNPVKLTERNANSSGLDDKDAVVSDYSSAVNNIQEEFAKLSGATAAPLSYDNANLYISRFIDAPIVKEAISKWGSKDKLVSAIAAQASVQKGEAYDWWNKFSMWVRRKFTSFNDIEKEELKNILTDAYIKKYNLKAINIRQDGNYRLEELYLDTLAYRYKKEGIKTTFEEFLEYTNSVFPDSELQDVYKHDTVIHYTGTSMPNEEVLFSKHLLSDEKKTKLDTIYSKYKDKIADIVKEYSKARTTLLDGEVKPYSRVSDEKGLIFSAENDKERAINNLGSITTYINTDTNELHTIDTSSIHDYNAFTFEERKTAQRKFARLLRPSNIVIISTNSDKSKVYYTSPDNVLAKNKVKIYDNMTKNGILETSKNYSLSVGSYVLAPLVDRAIASDKVSEMLKQEDVFGYMLTLAVDDITFYPILKAMYGMPSARALGKEIEKDVAGVLNDVSYELLEKANEDKKWMYKEGFSEAKKGKNWNEGEFGYFFAETGQSTWGNGNTTFLAKLNVSNTARGSFRPISNVVDSMVKNNDKYPYEAVVYDTKQIHIFGNSKDTEMFKAWKDKHIDTKADGGAAEYQRETVHPREVGELNSVLLMYNELKKMYPGIKATMLESVLDDYGAPVIAKAVGKVISIDIHKMGRDTVPHEFAHVYINLLAEVPAIASVLTRIRRAHNLDEVEAKEYLANRMGVLYANNLIKQDARSTKLLTKLWQIIASIFSKAVKDKVRLEKEIEDSVVEIVKDFRTGTNKEVINGDSTLAKTQTKMNDSPAKANPADGLFVNSPELAKIGTQQEYMEFIKTIFPNSVVQDVLAHDTGSVASGKHSFVESWMYNTDVRIDGRGGNYGLVSGEGFYMYKPDGKQWDDYSAVTGLMLVDMQKPIKSDSNAYKALPGDNYYKKMAVLADTGIQANPDETYMFDDVPPVTINSIVNAKTGFDGFINEVRPGLFEYVAWKPEQIHILGSKKDIAMFDAWKNGSKASSKPNSDIMGKAKAIGAELGLRDELVNETIAKLEKCSKG